MTRICRSLLVLGIGIVLLVPSPSGADIAPYPRFPNPLEKLPRIPNPFADTRAPVEPTGGVAAPKSPNQTVRLESENVTIALGEDGYEVVADFNFVNAGEIETVSVGFPRRGTIGTNMRLADFRKFDAWIEGHKAQFVEESGFFQTAKRFLGRLFAMPPKEDGRWLVCQVPFPSQKKTTVSTIYSAGYDSSGAGKEARFLIGYGSFWKDSIAKTVFTIDGKKIGGTKNFEVFLPKAHKPKLTTENAVTFEMEDWEPEPQHQLMIVIKPHEPEKRLEISW